jgi:LmbE family N-acetylglucosaminyl deacetylase
MLQYLKNKRVLVVVAHPDDEVLGVGSTINQLVTQHNVEARVVVLGEGITSRAENRKPEEFKTELESHKSDFEKATQTIGYQSLKVYDFPDNRFDDVNLLDIIKVIEKEKSDFHPQIIFTHHGADTNIDHQRTFNALITATRPQEGEQVQAIFTFETPSSTEWQAFNYPNYFQPNFFMPIDEDHLQAKVNAMECYQYEKRPFPHPRSPEALKILAQRRGVMVGHHLAEAFMLIRSIAH